MSQPQGSAACPECNLVLRFAIGSSPQVALKCPACGLLFETNVENTVDTPSVPSSTETSSTGKSPADKPVFKAKIVSAPESNTVGAGEPEVFEQAEIVEDDFIVEAVEAVEEAELVEPIEQTPLLPKPRLSNKPSPKPERPNKSSKRALRNSRNERSNQKAARSAHVGSHSTDSGGKSRALKFGLAALAAAALFSAFATGAFFLLRGGDDQREHPGIATAAKLTDTLEQYVAILETVSDGDSRRTAAKRLQELAPELDTLAMQALTCPMTEDSSVSQKIQQLLNDASPLQAKLLSESRRINENFALDDDLYTVDAQLKTAVNAIDKHLRYSVVELTPAESSVQRTCASIIASKRKINSTLAATGPTDIVRTVEKLQQISDELNRIADDHSKTGRRISIMAHNYEEANEAADVMREWIVTHTRDGFSTEHELTYTLDEVQKTTTRVAKALASGVDKLASTTKQRVDARLLAMDITPRSRVQQQPSATVIPPTTIIAAEPTGTNNRNRGYGARRSLASKPTNRIGASSTNSTGSNPSQPWQSGESANSAAASSKYDPAPKNSLAGAASTDDSLTNSVSDSDTSSGSRYSSQSQPRSKYRGEGCVQVKMVGRRYEDVEQEMRTLVSSLGVSRLDIAGSEDRVTLSFPYTGSLYRVARKVEFGEVVVCDSQSRTLFVRPAE